MFKKAFIKASLLVVLILPLLGTLGALALPTSFPPAVLWAAEDDATQLAAHTDTANERTDTLTSPLSDPYEPDDTCEQARPIATDGTVQQHTFHQEADSDWVAFEAISGTTYFIEGRVPPDSRADMVLELYDACDTLPDNSQDYTFSPDVRLQLVAPADGTYFLRLTNYDPDAAGSNVAYHLSVRALPDTPTPGAVVIVAGRIRANDPLQSNIYQVSKEVYRTFLSHGYDGERIYYLAADFTLDADSDGVADVDASANNNNLQSAITQWAMDKVGADRPFTLYMVDHGGIDKLYLNGESQTVNPDELDGWLDQLEAAAPGVKVNLIVESAHSGSFIDLTQSVSQAGRVVMSSTGANALNYASQDGAVFSDAFVDALGRGMSLYGAFEEAQWWLQVAHPDQTSWLDDNGDAVANSVTDGLEAQRRGLASVGTLATDKWPPYIAQAEVGEVNNGQGVIRADVRDDQGVLSVWAVIYKPSYVPPDPAETEELVQESLPTVALLNANGDGVYSSVYEGFDEMGEYRIVVYAVDSERLEARPKALSVQTGPVTATPTSTPTPTPPAPTATATATRTLTPTNTGTPTPTSTPTPVTPTATLAPTDSYEPDDSCEQASSISTDGAIQAHTFHQQADDDWLRFEGRAGVEYVIEARVPPESPADVVLELYDACDSGAIDNQGVAFSADVHLTFSAPADGTYYLHLLNDDLDSYGTDVAYHLSVRALSQTPSPGALIIVAGRYKANDSLQPNIHNVTNAVYRLFLANGYPKERIAYLATDLNLDADEDGQKDVTELANKANLADAITQWAVEQVGTDRALTLYLMDHGDHDLFYLDKPRGEWITPTDLDGWLTQVEAAAPGVKVNVIVEACYSGSFISEPVSQAGRVVIGTTGAYALAYASQDGAVFSDAFLTGLGQGMSLYGAFQEGQWAAQQTHADQTPWLDDDGDGFPNRPTDGQEASQRGFAFPGTLTGETWSPYTVQVNVQQIEGGRAEIVAEVRDDVAVDEVWAVVYPPSYQPPESSEELVPEPLPITLHPRGGDQYGGMYGELTETGTYRVVVYAKDNRDLLGRPKEMKIQTGYELYLPAITR